LHWFKKYNDTKVSGDFRPAESRFLKPGYDSVGEKKDKSLL